MPRVTEEHRQARRQQILVAAMRAFGRTGLHSTSMADVIAESELSAGAVYLYFKSKDDLIEAVAREVLGVIVLRLDSLAGAEHALSPAAVLDGLLERATSTDEPSPIHSLPLLIGVWSEGTRSGPIADMAQNWLGELRGRITALLQRWTDAGHPLPAAPGALAPVIMAMIQGFLVQATLGTAQPYEEYRSSAVALLTAAGLGD